MQQRRERWLLEISGVAVPGAAEILRFRRLLHDLENVRKRVHADDERVMAGRPEARTDAHEVGRLDRLVTNDQHRIVEKGALQALPRAFVLPRRQLGAEYF